jgi:hypothetical protein
MIEENKNTKPLRPANEIQCIILCAMYLIVDVLGFWFRMLR